MNNTSITKCQYGENTFETSFDQMIDINIPYFTANSGEIKCSDIETLYNTIYSNDQSYGSSGKYTISPQLDISDIEPTKKHSVEHLVVSKQHNLDVRKEKNDDSNTKINARHDMKENRHQDHTHDRDNHKYIDRKWHNPYGRRRYIYDDYYDYIPVAIPIPVEVPVAVPIPVEVQVPIEVANVENKKKVFGEIDEKNNLILSNIVKYIICVILVMLAIITIKIIYKKDIDER